ncbi:RHS repeat domain-containing protein [Paraburkholderia aromaticivorans]|uniref:RHS repeat domain-containing protein n=1 Tax=Paraburkholderia aromaticivorans TaxID=2026199 RepID=UPI00145621F0|nr:RHS repeat-associated core domain-containing protein [Paraburkholderia aromaticivorans]
MSDSSIPSIRTFQMDASTVGVLKSSVNLFRGDVNLTQALFSMPGRTGKDGLQIDLSIQYESNINQQAMTWNRDRPTGLLGMGWRLPLSVIVLDASAAPTPGDASYSINLAGVSSKLVREPHNPLLFSMEGALAKLLVNGGPVPADVRRQFVQRGLPLSATAKVVETAGQWRIDDDTHQQQFVLALDKTTLVARDGGESYQLVGYKFWKVLYYPRYERWAVTNETGQSMSFGGGVQQTAQTYNVSAGNSIEWGVQWVDDDGFALWRGNSAVTRKQQQYARAWHLQRAYSRFGEYVEYGYNGFDRDSSGLLTHGAEQQVGAGGKPYTKACYPTKVTDVFGRTATFVYQPKLWSNATPQSPREYADPHKAVPDTTPNGFQDCYETQFLSAIDMAHADGSVLFTLKFVYDPSPSSANAKAVANVAGASGDTCKRLLTGFALFNPAEQSLPGFRYEYHLDTGKPGNLGALSRVVYPTGGSASYAYDHVDLPICERALTLSAPKPLPEQSIARVWFGPDYAVAMWNNSATEQLSLQILTWNGQWNAWQPNPATALLVDGKGGTDLSTVSVLASDDFVAITYRTSTDTNLHLFRKDPARRAQWVAADVPGGGQGGCNDPSWKWPLANGHVLTHAGRNFVLVSQMSTSAQQGSYDVFTWNWPSQNWAHTTQKTKSYVWFAVGREYVATLDMQSKVSLSYVSPTGVWEQGGTASLGFSLNNTTSIALTSDVSLLAVSHLTSGGEGSGQQKYDVFVMQWNSAYRIASPAKFSFVDKFDNRHPTSWAPSSIGNTMIAAAGNLIRFDGGAWLANSKLKPDSGVIVGQQRYAYGPDYATLIHVGNGSPKARLLGYDANTASASWADAPASIDGLSVPPSNQETANWASGGNPDYLSVGTKLFFRGVATNWSHAVTQSIGDIQTLINEAAGGGNRYQLNAASVINEGPAFIACAAYDTQNPSGHATAASALVLRNGGVAGAAQMIEGEQMWTAQERDVPGQGTYPGGSSAFFTYTRNASNLDGATQVFLHRYAGSAVLGPIKDWPVASITIDDGLSESSTTRYVQNTATAACDASGEVIKYFESTVYPGGSKEAPVNGSVSSYYLNGNQIDASDDYYNMLDGLLHSVVTRDAAGATLTSVENIWHAYVKRAGHPTDPEAAPIQLYGAYVVQTEQQSISDGVASVQTTLYTPNRLRFTYTGQPASVTRTAMNGAGELETDVQSNVYACEVNAVSRALNDVSSIVAKTSTNAGIATSASVTALSGWPTLWGDDVLTPAEEADFSWTGGPEAFPFSSYAPGETPANWTCTTRNQKRAANGAVLQKADGTGTVCSTLFGTTLGLPVALIKGATLAECAWSGFQPYEDTTGWSFTDTTFDTANAWLGTRSLSLSKGASAATTVAPAAGRSRYLLAMRYQTPSGYDADGSGIEIACGPHKSHVAFGDTQGQWQYVSTALAVAAGTSSIGLRLGNVGSGQVLVDSVLLAPFGTDVTIQSWHADTRLLRATVNADGNANFTLYDRYNRPLGAVGGDGQVQELSMRCLSRQVSVGDSFNDASPNSELTLHMTHGGRAETFLDGAQWRTRWQPDDPGLWATADGILSKSRNAPSTLVWQGAREATAAVAFYIEIVPAAAPGSGTLAFQFGAGESIGWTPGAGWQWRAANGSTVQAALANPPRLATQWLLAMVPGAVLFFGNGQLLFSHEGKATPAQGLSFATGPNALQIINLITGADPRIGQSYTDGAGRRRQVHQLHGADSRVMEVVYDALDRQIAHTRVAPGKFGKGAAFAPLQYRSSFVDVPAFLAALQNSCAMQGDVAAYYAGQDDGPVKRSNDENYPYNGQRYGGTALDRVVESGKPGRKLSIHDVNTIQPADRKTTRTAYTASEANDPVEAGKYFATRTTTPSGYQGRQFVDVANRAVAVVQLGADGGHAGQTSVSPSYNASAGAAGILGTMKLPNAFAKGPHADPDAFVRTTLLNPLGQATAYSDPDTGSTAYLFDGKGQLRFVKMPLDDGEQYFLFSRYDALGRLVEEGAVAGAWDAAKLTAEVDNLAWPAASDGATVARIYSYDGDGSDPHALGKLTRVVTYNPAPASASHLGSCTVEEQWAYDALGRVVTTRLEVSGAAQLSTSATYHYNTLNDITQIDLPEGSPLPGIVYVYDDQGQIVSVGTPGSPASIASYTWTADGQLQSATRGALADVWAYDSPGSIVTHQASVASKAVFSQNFAYTPDLQIASRSTAFDFKALSDTRSVAYAYDGLQRFSSAVVANGGPGNQAVTEYDANGNIWKATQNGDLFAATLSAGTDRLEAATLANGDQVKFHYRKDGKPDQWRGMSMEYDAALGMVAAVTNGAEVVRYARGLSNHRVLRQQGDTVQICFQGAGHTPLLIWNDGKPQVCVWGANGLTAVHDGALKYPITDHQQTVWAVTDEAGGLVASFDYLPFGGRLAESGSGAAAWLFGYEGKQWDATLGFYDFGARLYDPALLRFVTPDSARQLASPYVFASNNPLNMMDPSGNLSVWAQAGIGAAMTTVALVGIVLSLVSLGAFAPAMAAAESGLAGATVGGEAAATAGLLGGEGAALTGATAGEVVVESTVAAGTGEVVAGLDAVVAAAAPLTTAETVGQNMAYVMWTAMTGGWFSGAGTGGLMYDIEHGRDFTAAGFFEAMGVGAITGLAGGGIGGLASMPAAVGLTQGMGAAANVLTRVLMRAALGMIGTDVATLLTDACTGKKVTVQQMLLSSAQGFGAGALSGTFSGLTAVANAPLASAIGAVDKELVRVSTAFKRAVDTIQQKATSSTAINGYLLGGGLLVGGYTYWGLSQLDKNS